MSKKQRNKPELSDKQSDAIRDTLRRTVESRQKQLRKRKLLFYFIGAMILLWLIVLLVLNL